MADQNAPQTPTGQSALVALNAAGETRPVSPTDPLPVTDAAGAVGAGNVVSARVSVLITATALVAARAARRRLLVKNIDTVNPIYVGPATVTVANGMEVKAGESLALFTTAALQAIASGGTVATCVLEEF